LEENGFCLSAIFCNYLLLSLICVCLSYIVWSHAFFIGHQFANSRWMSLWELEISLGQDFYSLFPKLTYIIFGIERNSAKNFM
jgi:hypothetical protein